MNEDQNEFFRNIALYGDPDEYLARLRKEADMVKMDPSGADRLDRIEAKIDAVMQGLERLYREGGQRLSGIEDEGSDRLDQIEKLLEVINLRLATKS